MPDSKDEEIIRLRARVKVLEAQLHGLGYDPDHVQQLDTEHTAPRRGPETSSLDLDEYVRYGRQMILPGFGLPCQLRLRGSSVLVVGAGGLGCPTLLYLASAGIGKLTIVDHDTVELSNLHRQVLHTVDSIGKPKVDSARRALLRIAPSIEITTHQIPLTSHTLSCVFTPNTKFDAVLDCSDTPSTRYLLSDVTARLGIPLISGAAQRTDGQLVVYNLPARSEHDTHGPCMRCVFPSLSRTGAGAERCSDVGILGPVVGVIGVLMATEAIKILAGFGVNEPETRAPSMLLYSALSPRPFRNVKLRSRRPGCIGCQNTPSNIDDQTYSNLLADIKTLQVDYVESCSVYENAPDPVNTGMCAGESRAKARDLWEALASRDLPVTIIDTRPSTEFGICSIPESTNIPLDELLKQPKTYLPSSSSRTFVVCRLGNDSQIAARALREARDASQASTHPVVDVIGGLRAWARDVDPSFPVY